MGREAELKTKLFKHVHTEKQWEDENNTKDILSSEECAKLHYFMIILRLCN